MPDLSARSRPLLLIDGPEWHENVRQIEADLAEDIAAINAHAASRPDTWEGGPLFQLYGGWQVTRHRFVPLGSKLILWCTHTDATITPRVMTIQFADEYEEDPHA